MTDDDGLDQRFSMGGQTSSRGQYFIYPSLQEKLESFFDNLVYFIGTLLKFTFITFLKSPIKLRKYIKFGPRASVHFENGPHAKIG